MGQAGMNRQGRVVIKGHKLLNRGMIVGRSELINGTGHLGKGQCECGATSPILESKNQRIAWHKQHREEVAKKTPNRISGNCKYGMHVKCSNLNCACDCHGMTRLES